MANHLSVCPACGELLVLDVAQTTGGSVQESVGVSYFAMPDGLDEAGQARFLASVKGGFPEAEYDAAVLAWEAKWYPDRVARLLVGTGVGEVTSLSISPLQLALEQGASLMLGATPAVLPATPTPTKATPAPKPQSNPTPQAVKLAAAAAVGATSLQVEKFTPSQHWPLGTSVNAKDARAAVAAKAKLAADVAAADAAVAAALVAADIARQKADWEAAHPKPVTLEEALAAQAKAKKALADAEKGTAGATPAGDPTKLAPGEEWDATAAATAEAKKKKVDMAQVEGTGAGGTVTKADVTAHAEGENA